MSVHIRPGEPLVFNHIPKTAGTSMTAALIKSLQPRSPFYGVDRAAMGAFSAFDELSPQARRALLLGPEDIPAECDALFGHIAPATTRRRYTSMSQLTILREPRTRLVSHWLFSRAHTDAMLRGWGGWADYVKVARSPLVEYLSDTDIAFYSDNLITRALVWPHALAPVDRFIEEGADEELLAAAMSSLEQFDFVGVTEDPQLTAALASWLGSDLVLERVNESPPLKRSLRCDIAGECDRAHELVEARTRLDAVLWERLATAAYLGPMGGAELAAERRRIYLASIERYDRAQQARPPVSVRARALVGAVLAKTGRSG